MKTKLLLCALLLCGCGKQAEHHVASQWEYKSVVVENYAHWLANQATEEKKDSDWVDIVEYEKASVGDLRIDDGDTVGALGIRTNGVSLAELGDEGWELVAAVPQTETIPKADHYGTDFNNIRTGKVILIFKRPH